MRPEHEETLAADAALAQTAASPASPASPGPGDHTATGLAGGSASRAPAPDRAGKRLGHFRIDRPLGAGGMGEVYLATDLALDRPVALKLLPDAVAGDAGRRERLIREARAQARVVHPNVGHIYFIGEDDGLLYFAMEYVPGQTVGERLAAGPLAADEALEIIRGAALGLREAQRAGVTHRDVKPSNLMIDGHGVVKVLDFGLAAGNARLDRDAPVAQTSLAGTPLYMAPEQGRGEAIDFRADIYALGATLYHLVSGRPPFQADSVDQLISLHATAARPIVPRAGRPRTAVAVIDALCARMMARAPADRFASYDELLRALEVASTRRSRPAGVVVRTIAVALDFVLVALLLAVLQLVIERVSGRQLGDAGAPLFVLFGVYQALLVGRFGRTAGMALFELEVVGSDAPGRPRWRAAILRALALTLVPGALAVADRAAAHLGMALLSNILSAALGGALLLMVLALLHASLRTANKRAPWDRVAGTRVRYRSAPAGLGTDG